MARIAYNRNTPFGALTSSVISRLVQLQFDVSHLMNVANSITGGGVTPANLETGNGAVTFGVPAGLGATFYADMQSLQAGLDAISTATISDMDLG